jgi:hypothetical protein
MLYTDSQELVTVQPLAVKDPKLRFNGILLEVSTKQTDRFLYRANLFNKSEDMGRSWLKISPDLTTNDSKKNESLVDCLKIIQAPKIIVQFLQ